MSRSQPIPPSVKLPPDSQWRALLQVEPQIEIWILQFGSPIQGYYLLICDLEASGPEARDPKPLTEAQMKNDPRSFDGYSHRYFWSKNRQCLAVQIRKTFDYSMREELTQVFLEGESLALKTTKGEPKLTLLPNDDFAEVFLHILS